MAAPLTPYHDLDSERNTETSFMSPNVKRNLRQLFEDDDSGLGMEDHEHQEQNVLSPLDFTSILRLDDELQFMSDKPHRLKRPRDKDDDCETPPLKARRKGNNVFKRSLSFGDQPFLSKETNLDHVKTYVNRSSEEDDLVGNGTNTFCLPTTKGKHQDLKSISPQTMADILTGKYDDVIGSYRVIDCRYPYEYVGGHIKGSENMYTQDQIQQMLEKGKDTVIAGKRNIIIFHCEFSSERGPKMMRYLRSQDRIRNQSNYPALNYPELYLLDGGYKSFFHSHTTLCFPMEYKPMLHQGHKNELRHFRSRSKSWAAGDQKTISRLLF